MLKQLKPWLLPVLSGIFIGTSYIPFPPWSSLFCFVPLWLFWSQQTRLKPVLIGGFITAFIFTMIGFNWMAHLLHEFAHLPWAVAVFGLLIYELSWLPLVTFQSSTSLMSCWPGLINYEFLLVITTQMKSALKSTDILEAAIRADWLY